MSTIVESVQVDAFTQKALDFVLDRLQPCFSGGFGTHHEYRLRVRWAAEEPTLPVVAHKAGAYTVNGNAWQVAERVGDERHRLLPLPRERHLALSGARVGRECRHPFAELWPPIIGCRVAPDQLQHTRHAVERIVMA